MSKQEQIESVFRVRFYQGDQIYEIYARSLGQDAMFGFLEVEEIVFGESNALIVNPEEEKLKAEFEGVICSYVPLHSVLRIDEVKMEGVAKVLPAPKQQGNKVIRPFPAHLYERKPE